MNKSQPDSPHVVISAATVPRPRTLVPPTSVAFTTKPAAHYRIYRWLELTRQLFFNVRLCLMAA
jgi:hypothetical protein